jgi:hypothetical protein
MVTKQNNRVVLDLGDLEELVGKLASLSKYCEELKYFERVELARQIKEKYGIPVIGPGVLPARRVVAITLNTDCDVHIYIPLLGEKID